MSNLDAWPSRQVLRSPYNHNHKAAIANTHLRPDVSSETIQKIANQMDKSTSSVQPISSAQNCQLLLAGMPDLQDASETSDFCHDASDNQELDKLLALGYRPLDGKWSETANSHSDKELLLE